MSDPVIDERTGLEILGRAECLELLAAHEIGRLAVVVAGRPLIFPIHYALDHDSVVFRTDEGLKLFALLHQAEVAFEIDGVDEANGLAWSVIVVGTSATVVNPAEVDELARAHQLGVWTPTAKPVWVRIRTGAVSGRRTAPPSPRGR